MAAQVESALDRLDGLIADDMAQTGVPGTAVAVVYGDKVVYEKCFGVRELGKPEPRRTCHSTSTPVPIPTRSTVSDRAGKGRWSELGPKPVRRPLFPWNRDAFSMPLTGADAAQIAQLGVAFVIGPEGQADAVQVGLGGVGPEAAAIFTRVASGD